MASTKTCPHSASERVFLSGTKVRELLHNGEDLLPEFTRPEVGKFSAKHIGSRSVPDIRGGGRCQPPCFCCHE